MTIRGSLRFPQYPVDPSAIADATGRTGFQVQMQAITHAGADDMLFAAELQNEDNRTNVLAKLMENRPQGRQGSAQLMPAEPRQHPASAAP